MLVAKPNVVLNHFFDHMGDKRSLIREDVLNIVMYALLTFPSNEFDLKVCIAVAYLRFEITGANLKFHWCFL